MGEIFMPYFKNELMDWAIFLHADSDAIIDGLTINFTLNLWQP